MKTEVRDTSIDAYLSIRGNGTAYNQRGKLFTILLKFKRGLTRQELARKSGIPINAVCGRVNELIKERYVTDTSTRMCKVTNKNSHVVEVKIQ